MRLELQSKPASMGDEIKDFGLQYGNTPTPGRMGHRSARSVVPDATQVLASAWWLYTKGDCCHACVLPEVYHEVTYGRQREHAHILVLEIRGPACWDIHEKEKVLSHRADSPILRR